MMSLDSVWSSGILLLLCNPVGIYFLIPAIAPILLCILAFAVSLSIVVPLLRPAYNFLDHCFKWVLPNFLRSPHLALIYYSVRCCCEGWEFTKVLYSSAYDIAVEGFTCARAVFRIVRYFVNTPLKALILWRLVHTWWDRYAYPRVGVILHLIAPLVFSSDVHFGDWCLFVSSAGSLLLGYGYLSCGVLMTLCLYELSWPTFGKRAASGAVDIFNTHIYTDIVGYTNIYFHNLSYACL